MNLTPSVPPPRNIPSLDAIKHELVTPTASPPASPSASPKTTSWDTRRLNLAKQRTQQKYELACYRAQLMARAEVLRSLAKKKLDGCKGEPSLDLLKTQINDAQKGIMLTKGWFDRMTVGKQEMEMTKSRDQWGDQWGEVTCKSRDETHVNKTDVTCISRDQSPHDPPSPSIDAARALMSVRATSVNDLSSASHVSDDEEWLTKPISKVRPQNHTWLWGSDQGSISEISAENTSDKQMRQMLARPSSPVFGRSFSPVTGNKVMKQSYLRQKGGAVESPKASCLKLVEDLPQKTYIRQWKIDEDEYKAKIVDIDSKVTLPIPKLSEDKNPRFFNTVDFRRGIHTGPVHEFCPVKGCKAVFSGGNLMEEALEHNVTVHSDSGQFVAPQKLFCFFRGMFHCTFHEGPKECAEKFKVLKDVFSHQAEDHGLVFPEYQCTTCSMRFDHETKLVRHTEMSHRQTWWR